jgi:chaperonin GroES
MAKLKLLPLGDRVIATRITEKKTASGLIIPESASKERPERGIVVAVGKGRKNDNGDYIPMEVKVGDEIVFAQYGPDEVKIDGIEYYILREDQIVAIVR